jgi:outer membrane protein OmpA-like peptidoglycan-associated protein
LWTVLIATLALAWAVPIAAEPQQKPELTAVALALALQDKGTVALHEVRFDEGKTTIKVESARTLASIGELLQSDPTLKVEIQVHTDNTGTPAVNLRLSRSRAAAVKTYLVEKLGITPERLMTSGFGDTRPVASNAMEEGRARNRRVELVKK